MKILICRITDVGVILRSKKLIQTLLQRGHEVVVATPASDRYQQLIDLGCKYIRINIEGHGTNPIADYAVYRQYKNILKTEKPDVALLYTTKPNIYCGIACRKHNIPVIMNITGMGAALGNKGLMQHMLVRMYKMACNGNNVKRMFFQNEDSREFFTKHSIGNPNVFYSIPGSGVDLNQFPVQPFPMSETVDFLFVARVLKEKGIDQYLDTARYIHSKYPNTVFHVLGGCDNEYLPILENETKNGVIQYHGQVNNVKDYQKLSQCTIQPSYYPEGVSNVILEAAASGRPVITTDHPGCREGVDDGVTGYIIPIKDSAALINAVERFLKLSYEERVAMGLAGRKKMEKEFDQKIIVEAYLDSVVIK